MTSKGRRFTRRWKISWVEPHLRKCCKIYGPTWLTDWLLLPEVDFEVVARAHNVRPSQSPQVIPAGEPVEVVASVEVLCCDVGGHLGADDLTRVTLRQDLGKETILRVNGQWMHAPHTRTRHTWPTAGDTNASSIITVPAAVAVGKKITALIAFVSGLLKSDD